MRKRKGLRKPANIRQAEWNTFPDHLKNKIINKKKDNEAKSTHSFGNPADFVKGLVAAEVGLPMDAMELLAPSAGISHSQRLTKMRPGGRQGYKEQNFQPKYKGTTQDIYSKLGGTSGSGTGFMGELFAPGALLTAPFAAGTAIKKLATKIPTIFNPNKVLDKVNRYPKSNKFLGGPEPIFANKGLDEVSQLYEKLSSEAVDGDIHFAKDRLLSMINTNDPSNKLFDKQIREYTGLDEWLEQYENIHAKGKKRATTVSLNDLEDFMAQNNLDLQEQYVDKFNSQYAPKGGRNQKTYIMTYNGKKPAMSLRTSNNLNDFSQATFQKPFEELTDIQKQDLEKTYHVRYPEDIDAKLISESLEFRSEANMAQHFDNNAVFHLRMDDRVGVGRQQGEKQLNVFEIQSDWYAQAHKYGVWDIEKLDDQLYQLERRNRYLQRDIAIADTPEGRPPTALKYADEIEDNKAEIVRLEAIKNEAKASKDIIDQRIDDTMEGHNVGPSVRKMPFISPGDNVKWMELALKRILKKAIDEDYDRVLFGNYEVHKKLYPSAVKGVKKIKIKKIPVGKKFKINKIEKGIDPTMSPEAAKEMGIVPINPKTEVSGLEYPYEIELYDASGNEIFVNKEKNNFYQDSSLNRTFGDQLAKQIREKASLKGKVVIGEGDLEPFDIGLENIKILYENILPNIINGKKGSKIFKKLGLKTEKVNLGGTGDLDVSGEFGDHSLDLLNTEAALGDNGINTFNPPGEGSRNFSTAENFAAMNPGAEGLEDVFNSSTSFARALASDMESASFHDSVPWSAEVNQRLYKVLNDMRNMEVVDEIMAYRIRNPDTIRFDDTVKKLMHPATRMQELFKIEQQLKNHYGIITVMDPNGIEKPRFTILNTDFVERLNIRDINPEQLSDVDGDTMINELKNRYKEMTSTGVDIPDIQESQKHFNEAAVAIKRFELSTSNDMLPGDTILPLDAIEPNMEDFPVDSANSHLVVPAGPVLPDVDPVDRMLDTLWHENDNVARHRDELGEYGINVSLSDRHPYLLYESDEFSADYLNAMENHFEYERMQNFPDRDIGKEREIQGLMKKLQLEFEFEGVPTRPPATNISPDNPFYFTDWQNEVYNDTVPVGLPEPIKNHLDQLRQANQALNENYDVGLVYGSPQDEAYFNMNLQDIRGENGFHMEVDDVMEEFSDGSMDEEPILIALHQELTHALDLHAIFRRDMKDFLENTPQETLMEIAKPPAPDFNGISVFSMKLKDDKGKLLKSLQPLLDGGKLYYGALPPGILAAGASQQSQEQSLLN